MEIGKKRIKQKNNSGKRNKEKPVGSFAAEDLFDDCPICQAEKGAIKRGWPLSTQELQKAFKQTKENGRGFNKNEKEGK